MIIAIVLIIFMVFVVCSIISGHGGDNEYRKGYNKG